MEPASTGTFTPTTAPPPRHLGEAEAASRAGGRSVPGREHSPPRHPIAATSAAAAISTSLTSIHSSHVWAWSIEPGPNTTVGTPAAA